MNRLNRLKQQALELMREHLQEDYNSWSFKWDNAKLRFGMCNHTTGTISISRPITEVNDDDQFKDTVLHEIAHAIAGARAGHGYTWKRVAVSVGCEPTRCHKAALPKSKYLFKCPCCGWERPFTRMPKLNYGCTPCCTKYNRGKYTTKYKLERVY